MVGKSSPAGKVISDRGRQSLLEPPPAGELEHRGGFRLLPRTGHVITAPAVERWLDERE